MALCLFPGCKEESKVRNLCRKHYGKLPDVKKKKNICTKRWLKENHEAWKESRYKFNRTPKGRFSAAKHRAVKVKNLSWELTLEQYSAFISLPCHYCGKSLNETSCGLDRLDNRLGYTLGNVVPCCKDCNFQKGSLEHAGFRYPRIMELMRELSGISYYVR